MSESRNTDEEHSLPPPPSYEEAVYGVPPPEAQNGSPPVTNITVPTSQPPVSQSTREYQYNTFYPWSQYTPPGRQNDNPPVTNTTVPTSQPPVSQSTREYQYNTSYPWSQYTPPRHNTASPYHMCPRGAEALLNLDEILVYPGTSGNKYKIKDLNKVPVMCVREKREGDCCDCCTCDSSTKFSLYSLEEVLAAQAVWVIDAINCCSYNHQHLEVMVPPEVPVGTVSINSSTKATVMNQSGDVLYSITREKDCCSYSPFQIFSGNGTRIGGLDNSRGIKNRLTLPRDMPIRHKILILFFTVFVQNEEDTQRESS